MALLLDGTIAHVGRHQELLAEVPEYRALLSADLETDPDDLDSDLDSERALR